MLQREHVLARIASEISASGDKPIVLVAVDGVDGAGKTCFADELAKLLGEPVIRASVDSFHNPRSVRYARGRSSPRGFFEDSFNYAKLKELLLDPLSDDPPRPYCCVSFDYRADSEVGLEWKDPPATGILVFDGIFLHRPELVSYWDYSIFLDVSTEVSVRRCLDREGVTGVSDDPEDPRHARYVRGQALYLEACDPMAKCTRRIANEVIEAPRVVA